MANGVTTPNLASSALLDSVVGNRSGNTVQQPMAAVIAQVAASEVMAGLLGEKASIDDLEQVVDQITTNNIVAATWASLTALTGTIVGQGAEVLDADTGTHTDPVVGGAVNNAGRYAWSASPAGWQRIGDTGLSGKASVTDLRATQAAGDDTAPLRDMAVAVAASPVVFADGAVMDVRWTLSGRTIDIVPGRTAISSAGRAIYPRGTRVVPDVPTGNVTDEARTLSYAARVGFVLAADGRLAHANVSEVVVRDAATSAVLVAGTDYVLDAPSGSITLPAAGADRAVLVNYSWSDCRYDLIEADLDGNILIRPGTARIRDAAEYLPRPGVGRIPLLIVRSTASEVTIRRYRDPRTVFSAAPWIAQRGRARRSMPALRMALASGNPVTIAGYGDSKTAIGTSTSYTANGAGRDIATTAFFEAQSADFIASVPLFDHGDGAGAVHSHIGWCWDLLRALQARAPGAHQYLNFGIGGTTSANDANHGGRVPARLAGLTTSGATLAVIGFGANELGSASIDTTGNLVAIGEACRTVGIDPVFIGLGRENASYALAFSDELDRWVTTARRIAAAADYLDAPFIDPTPLFGVDNNVGLLDPRDRCASNLYHHDGAYEFGLIGSALVSVLLD